MFFLGLNAVTNIFLHSKKLQKLNAPLGCCVCILSYWTNSIDFMFRWLISQIAMKKIDGKLLAVMFKRVQNLVENFLRLPHFHSHFK